MPGRGCHTRRQGSSDTVTRRCSGKETVRTTGPGNRAARPIPRSPTTGPNHPSSRAVRNRRSAPPPQIQPLRGQKSIGCRPIHAASGFLTLSASGRKESTRSFSTRAGPVIRTRLPMADGRAMPDQLLQPSSHGLASSRNRARSDTLQIDDSTTPAAKRISQRPTTSKILIYNIRYNARSKVCPTLQRKKFQEERKFQIHFRFGSYLCIRNREPFARNRKQKRLLRIQTDDFPSEQPDRRRTPCTPQQTSIENPKRPCKNTPCSF